MYSITGMEKTCKRVEALRGRAAGYSSSVSRHEASSPVFCELCSKPGHDPRRANVPIGTIGTNVVDGTSLLPSVLPMRFVSDVSDVSDVSGVSLGERMHPKRRCS